jgi:ABC-type bacteriocin/lantibiotic exporter with double-glycine peptidase domain
MKKDTLKKILAYFLPYWKEGMGLFILIFIINLASLATPYILKVIIDDIFPKKDFSKLVLILMLLVGIYLLRVAMAFVFDILYTKVSQTVIADMRTNIMRTVFQKPLAFFQDKQIGETIFILSNDVNNVQHSLSYLINDTLNNLILIASIIGIMLSINVELTLISVSVIPIIVFFIMKLSPKIHAKFKKVQESETKLFNYLTDELKNIKLIKTFNTSKTEEGRILGLQHQIVDLQVNNAKINSLNKNFITFIVASIPVIILIYGGKGVMNNTLTVGSLIAYIQYVNRLLPPVTSITNGYGTAIKSFVSMERINNFLEHNESKKPYGNALKVVVKTIEKITFQDVSFFYNEKIVIERLNTTFYAGETYLITGESGSGKSTILSLLCDLIKPNYGTILINGRTPYAQVKDMAKNICLVEKDNQIFSDTVFNNVDYGAFTNDEIKVKEALEQVNMLSKVLSLDNGIHTELNSNISIFSEGQKQRISLARVFMKQYSIIIIDEATASLDVFNERLIIQNIRQFNPEAIILIISHRFSFDDLCNQIYEFKNGRLLSKQTQTNIVLCA